MLGHSLWYAVLSQATSRHSRSGLPADLLPRHHGFSPAHRACSLSDCIGMPSGSLARVAGCKRCLIQGRRCPTSGLGSRFFGLTWALQTSLFREIRSVQPSYIDYVGSGVVTCTLSLLTVMFIALSLGPPSYRKAEENDGPSSPGAGSQQRRPGPCFPPPKYSLDRGSRRHRLWLYCYAVGSFPCFGAGSVSSRSFECA